MRHITQNLFKKYKKLVPTGLPVPFPLFVKSARGATVIDVEGRRFIDFTSGISAVNLGHGNSAVIRAIHAQAKKFLHTAFFVAPYELYLAVAQELIKITPGRDVKKVFFANSGAEAVENAVKIARAATGRPAIVSFSHAFHGRTLLTLSLTSKVKPYKEGFGPFAPEIYRLPYPYCRDGQNEDAYVDLLLKNIEEDFFTGVVAPDKIAAIIIEPIAGEGGFIVAPPRYFQGLAQICKKYGILLIVDEVQTGFGRSGKMFASEHSGIEPDLLVCAKSIASGMPLSAVIGKKEIMDAVAPGGLGGTFGGNPVSLAAALATLQEMRRIGIVQKALRVGTKIERAFKELAASSPIVGEARGLGAMWAIEIVKDKKTREPDPTRTKKIISAIFDKGVMILSAGMHGNVIRALPPLMISPRELTKALTIIKEVVQKF